MRARLICLTVLLLLLCLLLSGCWSRRDIELVGFIALAAIDQADNDMIELSVQFIITEALGGEGSGGGGGGEAPVWVVSAEGRNLAEAVAELRTYSSRLPVWFHVDAIIIGEELAKVGIAPVLEYALRNRELRLTTHVMVAEGKAKDILATTPKMTNLPSRYVRELINLTDETSTSQPVRLIELMRVLIDERGSQPWLPLIRPKPKEPKEGTQEAGGKGEGGSQEGEGGGEAQEEKPEALVLEGMAVFQNDRMIGKLDGKETRAILWLRGESVRTTINIPVSDQGEISHSQTYARRTLRVIRDGDQFRAFIKVFEEGDVAQHNLPSLELNPQTLLELNELLTAQIEQDLYAAMARIQELGTDVVGIGTRLYRLHPEAFSSMDWNQVFPTLSVDINVQADFRRTGSALQSPLTKGGIER